MRPGKQSKLVWSRDKWNRPFWKDVANKILWGAGCEFGYVCGGDNGTNNISNINRIRFPFDSGFSSHSGNFSIESTSKAAVNSSNYCFISLGSYSTIDRVTFPFDSGTTIHVGNLYDSLSGISSTDGTDFVTMFV